MILSQFTSCGLSLIVLVCWLGVNDAVPFRPNHAGKVRPTASQQSKDWSSTKKVGSVTGKLELLGGTTKVATDTPIKSLNNRRSSSNFNSNINVNINGIYPGKIKPERKYPKLHKEELMENVINGNKNGVGDRSEESYSSNSNSKGSDEEFEVKNIEDIAAKKKAQLPEKCVNEGDPNRSYTRSFPINASTIDVTGAFKVVGEPDAKKTSSVHIDEDITLCWIETITIKEDPAFNPPKRLVIREFGISFENSATIPENYLECSKLDGEITPGDVETVCKSSLQEVIDQNTKRSHVANFTSVSHVGPIVVRQEKTVRCAMGRTVSKDIFEWPDGSDNPKKRVEIKVGPSMRDVGIASDQGSEECTFGAAPSKPGVDGNSPSVSTCNSDESCETSIRCEDDEECNRQSTISACENGDCATESLPEEIESTSYLPDKNEPRSAQVEKRTTTESPDESSIKDLRKADQTDEDSCPEDDNVCKLGRTTVEPTISTKNTEPCSGEDCYEQSSEGSTIDIPSDENYETSGQCSGENCSSKEEPGTAETEAITTESSESCQEGSESCSCSGSCSIDNSEESGILKNANQLTDGTTVPSVYETNTTILNDTGCDTDSGECSDSSGSSAEEEGTTSTSLFGGNDTKINLSVESKIDQGSTELPDIVRSTEVLGSDEVSSVTETVRPCDDSNSEGCARIVPGDLNLSNEISRETETYSSTTEGKTIPAATQQDSEFSGSESIDDEQRSSCGEGSDDENCESTQSEFEDNDSTTDTSPEGNDTNETILPTSENSKKVTNPDQDAVTSIPSTITDSETSLIETSTRLSHGPAKNETKISDEESSSGVELVTACSEDGSGDCLEVVTSSASVSATTKQTGLRFSSSAETTLSPEPCESSGSCESKEILSSITEKNQLRVANSTETTNNSGDTGCEDGNESCDTASSGASSENCEDGSSNGDCTSNTSTSESCDLSSNSCSSETNSSTGLTDEAITTTTETTAKELEHFSTTIDNVSTTAETRRTSPTLSLMRAPTKGRHKLALRIKVLLEHINERKEKEKLIQVEKHLLLNERPEEHGNHSLVWQIKSLNNSMNMETFKSIFNCTALDNFTEDFSHMTEFKQKHEERTPLQENLETESVEQSTTEVNDESRDGSMEESDESSLRQKREISISKGNREKEKNITDIIKVKAIRESLPGVNEDFQKGVDHVLCRISQELDGPASGADKKPAESSSSKILKMLADPTDRRVHSRRRKRASKVEGVVSVKELEHPVNGEEIGQWSNERFFSAADGGRVRSLLEFKILRDPGEDSRRIPSGS